MPDTHKPGSIGWFDIAVPDAEALRDFYSAVTGWTAEPLDMGGYSDYVMKNPAGDGVAGICHARGANAAFPAMWLAYIIVTDLDASVARCLELGGKVLAGPKGEAGQPRYAVIQDPAGACAALYQPA
jgi:predicted enzyme related to lactoylglutathione lyase